MIRRPMILLFSMAVLTAFTEAQSDETESKSRFEGSVAGESRELVAAMVFHWCPAGEFTMGSPPSESGRNSFEAQQKEILKAGYWLQETEVTQKQWKDLMGTTPWKGQENVQDGENNAASYIDQRAAVEFCRKLTARELAAGRLPSGWAYSLPSEAQWEYGCRAGTRTAYSFGDDVTHLGDYAWWGGFQGGGTAKLEQYAHPVAQKKPNAWGLKDMHGNVHEWCSDVSWPESRCASATLENHRVFRGGSWAISETYCRSASRARLLADAKHSFIGFRVAAMRSSE